MAKADTVKIVSDTFTPFEFKDSDQTHKGLMLILFTSRRNQRLEHPNVYLALMQLNLGQSGLLDAIWQV